MTKKSKLEMQKELIRLQTELQVMMGEVEEYDVSLESLLKAEAVVKAKESLYAFYVQAWDVFETVPFIGNWHLEAICDHLEAVFRGDIQDLIVEMPPRCQPGSALILKADGSYTSMNDIKIGDSVVSIKEGSNFIEGRKLSTRQSRVSNKIDAGSKNCLRLHLSDGTYLDISETHPVYVHEKEGYVEGKYLEVGQNLFGLNKFTSRKKDNTLTKEEAFLLGLWCAEGNKLKPTQYRVAIKGNSILRKEIHRCCLSMGWVLGTESETEISYLDPNQGGGTRCRSSIWYWFDDRFEGHIPEKFNDLRVPPSVFNSNDKNKLIFISALEAGDGTVDTFSSKITFQMSCYPFLRDLILLLQQLGYTPTICKRKKRSEKHSDAWTVQIAGDSNIQKAKKELFLYQDQKKLDSIETRIEFKNKKVPTQFLDPKDFDCHVRYRIKKSKYLTKEVVKKYLLPENKSKYEFILNSQHQFIQIRSIESLGILPCYDITVEDNHNYFSGTILTHNSSKCLEENQLVTLPDGSLKAIRDIEVGEVLPSYNLKTRRFEDQVVLAKEYTGKRNVIEIRVEDKVILCTAKHRLLTSKGYIEAGKLNILKDYLAVLNDDGLVSYEEIDSYSRLTSKVATYDIQVSVHENFVAEGFISHNSSIINVVFPVWCWLHNPKEKFITCAHSDSLAVRDSLRSRQLIQSLWFQENWKKDIVLKPGVNQKSRYENTANGYRIATSVGGKGVGEGYDCHHPDTFIWTTKGNIKIKDLFNNPEEGVEIYSYNIEKKEIESYLPQARLQSDLRDRLLVELSFYDGTSTICTEEHKWYTKERGYTKALDLINLRIKSRYSYKRVVSVKTLKEPADFKVYTLAMPPNGNYFVAPDETGNPILSKNCLVVDDPIKPSDTNSKVALQGVIDWWTGTMSTRANSANSRRVVMHQRLNEMDLIGYILSSSDGGAGWDRLTLPMEYEGSKYVTTIGWTDPRQEEGDLLWPSRIPQSKVNKLKKDLGTFGYSAQYQQRPVSKEGGIIKKKWIKYYNVPYNSALMRDFDVVITSWDLSFSDQGDYTVGQVWGKRGVDKILIDEVRGKWTFTEQVHQLEELRKKWPTARAHLVEKFANGEAAIDVLRKRIPGFISVNPKEIGGGDKEVRLSACSLDFEAGNVHIPSFNISVWSKDWVDELTTFPKGKHDDRCFTGDTLVRTKEGLKPIKDIEINDLVLSHKNRYKPVIKLYENKTTHVLNIHIEGGESKVIKTTDKHPFLVKDGGWVKACNLRQGDILVDCENPDKLIRVVRLNFEYYEETVYNLEVEEDNSYHIQDCCVHNCDSTSQALNWLSAKMSTSTAIYVDEESKYIKEGYSPNLAKQKAQQIKDLKDFEGGFKRNSYSQKQLRDVFG